MIYWLSNSMVEKNDNDDVWTLYLSTCRRNWRIVGRDDGIVRVLDVPIQWQAVQ